jgi:hypothetical protein
MGFRNEIGDRAYKSVGIAKLQRTLFDEIRKFDAKGLLLRAYRLQADDQRKLAFEQSCTDKFSNTLFSSMPNKEIKLRNAEFTTAVKKKLGTLSAKTSKK